MRELERVRGMLKAHQDVLEHELRLGALLQLVSLSLHITLNAASDEAGLQSKMEALRGPMAIDKDMSNFVPMLSAALASDARRVAPHWTE